MRDCLPLKELVFECCFEGGARSYQEIESSAPIDRNRIFVVATILGNSSKLPDTLQARNCPSVVRGASSADAIFPVASSITRG